MSLPALSRGLLACTALALLLAGCGPNEVGQYSDVKMNWDESLGDARYDQMRERARLTQRDH